MAKLLEINTVRLKGVERELGRIADALETFMAHAYGISLRPSQKPADDDSETLYASDDETLKHDLMDVAEGRRPDRVIEDEA